MALTPLCGVYCSAFMNIIVRSVVALFRLTGTVSECEQRYSLSILASGWLGVDGLASDEHLSWNATAMSPRYAFFCGCRLKSFSVR